ncbi:MULTISPECIES: SHOCT domain-containing protein [unclassified Halorubrum]|uniref:SHOCT domain-containing protein n=1 Tax=unclassified Halorubrum TaxID=2642239 RepID=UPI0010F9E736|nr:MULTISPECIES: SHOCT domain-containing protein [unclassified Halorubrum]TKX45742.1 SHOCT domain-containing protein [Halorubrum sp. ARQ200]TKX51181.1 SHOCT domain-containing protein [Halorubrum sp. ASP121]
MADDETLRDRLRRNASGIAATTVTGTWLAALLLGFDWWLGFMLFGYIVIVPVVSMLFDEEGGESDFEEYETDPLWGRHGEAADSDDESADTADALERLRTRYANGDLTDEQFERKLDRLLETETPEDAAEWAERNRAADRERDVERER